MTTQPPGPPGPPGCTICPVPGKGLGLFTQSCHQEGVQVFRDEPLFVVQHSGNRRVAANCARCCAFLGPVQPQLERIFSEARFEQLLGVLRQSGLMQQWEAALIGQEPQFGGKAAVPCSKGCGELYCSTACRDAHYMHSHNLLCAGLVETEDHPLIKFKYLAIENTDTLLLAAQVFAHLVNRAKAVGGGADTTRALLQELFAFCHAPLKEASRPPPGRAKDVEFALHCDRLVGEAAELLKAAFDLHSPSEAAALFEHGPLYLSELLGLFEYNNIDVEVASPLGSYFQSRAQMLGMAVAQGSADAQQELQLLEALLREKEWVMRCVWGEETTGIFDDGLDEEGDDIAMSEDEEDDLDEGAISAAAEAAMAKARQYVDGLSMNQLLQTRWPAMHGTALFVSVARINHSCAPNLKVDFPDNSCRLRATALQPLSSGAELCISYIHSELPVQERRRQLAEYGFACNCERCIAEDSGNSRRTAKRLK
mmetsp:Transcript_64896/g.120763  ORF Transcript_64896/g.120763 Transcript_64896/m.120763 type:complete len:482 (-) Transcript_64896:9-1454(-)